MRVTEVADDEIVQRQRGVLFATTEGGKGKQKKNGKFSGDSSSRLPRDVCRRDHDVEGPDCLGNRASRRTPHDDHT